MQPDNQTGLQHSISQFILSCVAMHVPDVFFAPVVQVKRQGSASGSALIRDTLLNVDGQA